MNISEITITLPRRRPFKNIYQFKITVLETNPPVWRRIQVPENYTFYDLHAAIQDAIGWLDYHLHMFDIEDASRSKGKTRIECPFCIEDIEEEEFLLTTEVPLKEFFRKSGDRALYTYDFGDDWELDVLLERILPREPKRKYPACLDGRLAGPPEDCGSISGYYDCVKAVKNRDDSEGLLTWVGNWKPDKFIPKKVLFENPRTRLKFALRD